MIIVKCDKCHREIRPEDFKLTLNTKYGTESNNMNRFTEIFHLCDSCSVKFGKFVETSDKQDL